MAAAVPPTSVASGRISCRCAAAANNRSHSGILLADIEVPEVVTLRVGVGEVCSTDLENAISHLGLLSCHVPKLFPVIHPAAGDYIVHGRQCPVAMVQVPVPHASNYIGSGPNLAARNP